MYEKGIQFNSFRPVLFEFQKIFPEAFNTV